LDDSWDCVVPDDMSGVGNVVRPVVNTVSGVNGAGAVLALAGGADCRLREGRMLCTGGYWPFSDAVTIGDVIIVDDDEISDDLFRHEANYSNQWAMFGGWGFLPAYVGDWTVHGFNTGCMWFEQVAGTHGTSCRCGRESALGSDC
jgi:hypothetical protein